MSIGQFQELDMLSVVGRKSSTDVNRHSDIIFAMKDHDWNLKREISRLVFGGIEKEVVGKRLFLLIGVMGNRYISIRFPFFQAIFSKHIFPALRELQRGR